MLATVKFKSSQKGEINNFLSKFYNTNLGIENNLTWNKEYTNPIEIAELVGTFVDNSDSFDIRMWISLDKDIFIDVTDDNVNYIIKYLYERYPY